MRIAVFSDNFYPELSGIADSIMRSGIELARRGHSVAFYAPRYSAKNYQMVNRSHEEPREKRIEIRRFASFPYPTPTGQGRLVIPSGFRSIAIRRFHPDVAHVHLPFGVGLEGLLATRLLRIPLIGTNHTPMSEFVRYSPFRGKQITAAILKYTVWFYNHCHYASAPSNPVL
ncbi:MAG: hypothetical protein RIQ56_134, partial [Candidatus Parcubacteria bacterium]